MTRIISQPDHGDKIIDEDQSANSNLQIFFDDIARQFNLLESVQSIEASGAVDIVSSVTEITTSTSQVDLTLVDGVPGQSKKLILIEKSGAFDAVLTPVNFNDGSSLTFTAAFNSIELVFSMNIGWFVFVNNGVTVNP